MVMGRVEKALGLPKLSEMSKSLEAVDSLTKNLDMPRLRALKSITDNLVQLQAQGGQQGMQVFGTAMQMLAGTPTDKLDKVAKITDDIRETANVIQKIVKALPVEALKNLPLDELAGEIKKAMKGG
jgi:hypothetical protein